MFTIRKKIILILVTVVAVVFFVFEAAVGTYLRQAMVEQSIANEQLKMTQLCESLDTYCGNIINFGMTVAIENRIQTFISGYDGQTPTENIRSASALIDDVFKRAMIFNCIGVAVVLPDEKVFYRNGLVMDTSYFAGIMDEEWFRRDARGNYFSRPFRMYYSNREIDAMAFVLPLYDLTQFQDVSGYCVFLFSYDQFTEILGPQVRDSAEGFYWVNSRGDLIWGPDGALPGGFDLGCNYQDALVAEDGEVFTILKSCQNSDWTLISRLSKSRVYEMVDRPIRFSTLFMLVGLALVVLLSMPVLSRITRPIRQLSTVMRQVVASKDMDVSLKLETHDEMQTLASCFNEMMSELKRYMEESMEYERAKANIEYELLLSQINPHFIYNCLNSIIMMMRMNRADEAISMTDALIRVLQNNIRISEGSTLGSVEDEVEIVACYLNIQRIRYRNRFQIEWFIEEELEGCQIPRLILQPLVENAILHSILPSGRPGTLVIAVRRDGQALLLSVSDDGQGFDPEILEKIRRGETIHREVAQNTNIGLSNIRQRVAFLFGDSYGIEIESRDGDTTVTVRLPLVE